MKKLTLHLSSIIFVLCFLSCSSQKWSMIGNEINTEQLLLDKFPKLYSQSKSGEIIINKIEQQIGKNGAIKYRVTYTNTNDDDDSYLWETIYRPMLD